MGSRRRRIRNPLGLISEMDTWKLDGRKGFFKNIMASQVIRDCFFLLALFPCIPISCSVSCLVSNWALGGSMTFFFTFSAKGIERILILVWVGWRTRCSPPCHEAARASVPPCMLYVYFQVRGSNVGRRRNNAVFILVK